MLREARAELDEKKRRERREESERQSEVSTLNAEISRLRKKLKESREEYSKLSEALLTNETRSPVTAAGGGGGSGGKSGGKRDKFEVTMSKMELKESKEKNALYEREIAKIESETQISLEELRFELKRSRERVLELIDDKSRLEKEIFALRSEKKTLRTDLQDRDNRVEDLKRDMTELQALNKKGQEELHRKEESLHEALQTNDLLAKNLDSVKLELEHLKRNKAKIEGTKDDTTRELEKVRFNLKEALRRTHILERERDHLATLLDNAALRTDSKGEGKAREGAAMQAEFSESIFKILEDYEFKLQENEEALETLTEELKTQLGKNTSVLSEMQDLLSILVNVVRALDPVSPGRVPPNVMILKENLAKRRPQYEAKLHDIEDEVGELNLRFKTLNKDMLSRMGGLAARRRATFDYEPRSGVIRPELEEIAEAVAEGGDFRSPAKRLRKSLKNLLGAGDSEARSRSASGARKRGSITEGALGRAREE